MHILLKGRRVDRRTEYQYICRLMQANFGTGSMKYKPREAGTSGPGV